MIASTLLSMIYLIAALVSGSAMGFDQGERVQLCAATIDTCRLACSGATPVANQCNSETLEWRCECPSGATKSINTASFPIEFRECQQAYGTCITECLQRTELAQESCAEHCNYEYDCGTDEAHPRHMMAPLPSKTSSQNATKTTATKSGTSKNDKKMDGHAEAATNGVEFKSADSHLALVLCVLAAMFS